MWVVVDGTGPLTVGDAGLAPILVMGDGCAVKATVRQNQYAQCLRLAIDTGRPVALRDLRSVVGVFKARIVGEAIESVVLKRTVPVG